MMYNMTQSLWVRKLLKEIRSHNNLNDPSLSKELERVLSSKSLMSSHHGNLENVHISFFNFAIGLFTILLQQKKLYMPRLVMT
jgi:hypothetical protein